MNTKSVYFFYLKEISAANPEKLGYQKKLKKYSKMIYEYVSFGKFM